MTPPRRRGRPCIEGPERAPEITVAIGASDYAEVQRLAAAAETSIGAVIRRAVRGYLQYTRQSTTTAVDGARAPRSVIVKRSGL